MSLKAGHLVSSCQIYYLIISNIPLGIIKSCWVFLKENKTTTYQFISAYANDIQPSNMKDYDLAGGGEKRRGSRYVKFRGLFIKYDTPRNIGNIGH